MPGPAEFLGELKLQMEELNTHVGGCVEALEEIVAGADDFATLAKCVTQSGALLAFAQLNATALRKLGTKYDKRRRERLAHMGGIDSISAQAAVDRLLEGAPFCTAHTDALRALEAEVERRACPHAGASPLLHGQARAARRAARRGGERRVPAGAGGAGGARLPPARRRRLLPGLRRQPSAAEVVDDATRASAATGRSRRSSRRTSPPSARRSRSSRGRTAASAARRTPSPSRRST